MSSIGEKSIVTKILLKSNSRILIHAKCPKKKFAKINSRKNFFPYGSVIWAKYDPILERRKIGLITYMKMNKNNFFGLDPPIPLTLFDQFLKLYQHQITSKFVSKFRTFFNFLLSQIMTHHCNIKITSKFVRSFYQRLTSQQHPCNVKYLLWFMTNFHIAVTLILLCGLVFIFLSNI